MAFAACRARPGAALPRASLSSVQPRTGRKLQQRHLQDIAITRTGKPILRVSGGRSSLGGNTATVFGATGFLGRYIVTRLARQGCTVVIPFREEMEKRHLKVQGDLGRVVFIEYDLRNTQSIEESVRHSDMVYNLVGRDYPTKNFDFEDVHIEGASRIAEAVAKYDVDRFVHVSSYNADKDSPSEFFRTKALGEEAVRSIFPETTIVRPAPMYGYEDRLLNVLGGERAIYTFNHLRQKLWPVHVIDVGSALEKMIHDDSTASQTYELFGPREYSMAELLDICNAEVLKKNRPINIPGFIAKPLALALNKLLWFATINPDTIVREHLDQHIDAAAKTFADLGITPTEVTTMTYEYLQGYRSSSYYDLPPRTEREKREERKMTHVLDDRFA